MNNDHSSDFSEDQFKNQNKDVEWLCRTIKNSGCVLGALNARENTIEWLNEILQQPWFFESVLAVKRSLALTDEAKRLRDETAEDRAGSFKDMSEPARQAVKRLNRLTMEAAHPKETPASRYQLTAMIRTRRAEIFLEDYPNTDAFKRDMKEHRNDIDWGMLVRADRGTVAADYFSAYGDRDKIGMVDTEPKGVSVTPEGLTPQQALMREAAIRYFKTNKIKAYIAGQMEYVNGSLQLGEAIKFLFDESGNAPALAPLEDIIAERERTEAKIKWLEAICSELRSTLVKLKAAEEDALDLVGQGAGKSRD